MLIASHTKQRAVVNSCFDVVRNCRVEFCLTGDSPLSQRSAPAVGDGGLCPAKCGKGFCPKGILSGGFCPGWIPA